MKIFGILLASLAALLLGAKLVLAAFGPVLPPDFDRAWDQDFASAYWSARGNAHMQMRFFASEGRWPRTPEELYAHGEAFARWKERDESRWRRYVDERAAESEVVRITDDTSIVRYRALTVVDREVVPLDTVDCTITLDAAYAAAYARWDALPGTDSWRNLPDDLDLWPRMDCRRRTGVRNWLSWTGLDRYRQPPPQQYNALEYAERAFDRVSPEGAAAPPEPPG